MTAKPDPANPFVEVLERADETERLKLLKRYHGSRDLYEKLADEVAFCLKKRLRDGRVPIAHVSQRVKTFESLTEKLSRKQYEDPWKEISDFAGVRVVFLYASTRSQIEAVIENEFKVIEKVDKQAEMKEDQFGYGALHYIVCLDDKITGARYEDLKHLVCEIQVRTVMQDAWALIDHHLVYKNESSIPSKLKRRMSTISGMFENIDEQFDAMREDREVYLMEVSKKSKTEDAFLDQELNFETMAAYLAKISEAPISDLFINDATDILSKAGIKKLAEVESLMRRTAKARKKLESIVRTSGPLSEIIRAALLVRPEFRVAPHTFFPQHYASVEHLVEE